MTKRSTVIAMIAMLVLLSMMSTSHGEELPKRYYQLTSLDLDRGKKLADTMLCAMCHSPMTMESGLQMYNEKLRLTGGVKIVSPPDGTFFTKNLTPDMKTGVGTWSFDELAMAITQGVAKDGRGLRVMPSHYYKDISNEDLNALIGYLKSVPPVQKQIPANIKMEILSKLMAGIRLFLPFIAYPSQDWFFGDHGTSLVDHNDRSELYLSPKSQEPLVVQPVRTSPDIERGKYLVTTAACAFCHTPVTAFGQSQKLALSGGFKVIDPVCGTVYSKNLTPDPDTGLGKWSDQEIVNAIKGGVSKGRERLLCSTIMPWQAYSQFSDDDMRAIVAYLRAIPPVHHQVPESTPPTGKEPKYQKFTLGDAGD
ncbi:MAG TPA: c-type cytochrome [Methylophilaceae bacterium]|nr:c-type cytochrome [Methylophilaceae bacterium]